jgi:hypothetical protein
MQGEICMGCDITEGSHMGLGPGEADTVNELSLVEERLVHQLRKDSSG